MNHQFWDHFRKPKKQGPREKKLKTVSIDAAKKWLSSGAFGRYGKYILEMAPLQPTDADATIRMIGFKSVSSFRQLCVLKSSFLQAILHGWPFSKWVQGCSGYGERCKVLGLYSNCSQFWTFSQVRDLQCRSSRTFFSKVGKRWQK